MKFDISVRIAGEAGQGIQTVGSLLCLLTKESGYELFTHQDYMSRVRGGNNFYQVRVSSEKKSACRETIDVLAALSAESVPLHGAALAENGKIIADGGHAEASGNGSSLVKVPFREIAVSRGGKTRYMSSVALGAVAGMLAFDPAILEIVLRKEFEERGAEIIDKNIACARSGYEIGRANALEGMPKSTVARCQRYLIGGNEAVALGAVYAGCRFYSGYPMTPSTTIMETLAGFSSDVPIVVEQAEDEIAAINMVIGASYGGIRAMTATSGGGFSLMTEGLSLAAMTETPVVVVLGQRPAPATGLPTRTEQADLHLAIFSGHGEFARVVYSPGNIEEAFELTVKAFDVSERLQVPVVVLTDQYLADMTRVFDGFDTQGLTRKRRVISREESVRVEEYRRYRFTESGVTQRAIPSWIPDVIYADSDEHDEEGHIAEDSETRTNMVDKRFRKKMEILRREIAAPICFRMENARFLLLGFGSTRGVIEEICDSPDFSGVGGIHFPQVWPFPLEMLDFILKKAPSADLITVENNAGGQLAKLIKRETSVNVVHSILKYDGRPFTVEELERGIRNYMDNHGKPSFRQS